MLSIRLRKYFVPKSTWLLKVGVGVGVGISTRLGIYLLFGPGVGGVFFGTTSSIGLVVFSTTTVTIHHGTTITDVVVDTSTVWTVYWDLVVVFSKTVAVGVWVREKSTLEHLVVGWFNAWD